MKCSRIIRIVLFSLSLLEPFAWAGTEAVKSVAHVAHESELSQATPVYIKRYSGKVGETNSNHTLVPGSIAQFESDLAEVNKRCEVKVYIHLINGLSLPFYQSIPEETKDLSTLLSWMDRQKNAGSDLWSDAKNEARSIADRISDQEAKRINTPAVFCSLIQYEIQEGIDKGKKITFYHSSVYGTSSVVGPYHDKLDQKIKATKWNKEGEWNLRALVGTIRQTSQEFSRQHLNTDEFATLRKKLLAESSRTSISVCIDTLDKRYIELFDDTLRGYVVYKLFGPADIRPSTNNYSTVSAYSDPKDAKNALLVLENISDNKLSNWYSYIVKTKIINRTVIQQITNGLTLGFFSDDTYTDFIKIINKQITHLPSFNEQKEQLFANERNQDRFIFWDKSYFLNLFKTAPIHTNKYAVELQPDGKIKLTKSFVEKWFCVAEHQTAANGAISYQTGNQTCSAVWKEQSPILLDPFEIVGFVNRSDLSLLTEDRSATDGIVVVPAIHLLYASKMKWNEDVGKGFSLAFDLATVVVPVTKLTYGPKLARQLIYGIELSDKVATTGSIAVTLGAIEDEKFKEVITAYGRIHILLTLGVTGYKVKLNELRDLADYVRAVSNQEAELKTLAKTNQKARDLLELKDKINNEAIAVRGENWVVKYASQVSPVPLIQGKLIGGGKNLVDVKLNPGEFRQFGYAKSGEPVYRAVNFWNKESDDFIHFISKDGKHYIKHDPVTGRLLFLQIDTEPPKFLSYALDEGTQKIISINYDKVLENLKTIHGLSGKSTLDLRVGTIRLSKDKANMLLGKYAPNEVPGISGEIGTDDVIAEMSMLKNYSFANNGFVAEPGSILVLNIPEMNIKNWMSFFDDFNVDFLDVAIRNKDQVELILVSDPRKANLLDIYDKTAKDFIGKPSGFAKEIRYLRDRGIRKVKLWDGTSIDLLDIKLDHLSWQGWNY